MPEGVDISLTTPVERLPGVGPSRATALRALELTNLGRLIAHLPARHERVEPEAPIADLTPGQIVSARGEVTATRIVMRGKRPRFEAVLMDPSGRLDLVWFNATYLRDKIHPGMRLRVQGKAKRFGYGLQIANPAQWSVVDDTEDAPSSEARLRPVYPASEAISSRQIEQVMTRALPLALPLLEDHVSDVYRTAREMPSLREAYRAMHAPATMEEVLSARRRLAYDELLLLQLAVALKRRHLRDTLRAPALRWNDQIDAHIRGRFPFRFTPSQDEVVRDIVRDLSTPTPTNRLIQGDVGSGKTAVALYAMLMAVAGGGGSQAAMMAPTELLAEQHFASIDRTLRGSKVRVELLTGTTGAGERESILSRVASGEVDILVGTHALLTSAVRFANLAVAVIDEQHRFGVSQRAALRSKGAGGGGDGDLTPHVLVMTATPIPRTLAITLFGDLDISTISALPPGRSPIATRVVTPEKRDEVYAWVRTKVDEGAQAYVVAPAIERASGGTPGLEDADEADFAPPRAEGAPGVLVDVRSLAERLEGKELAGGRVAVLHGRLKRPTREAIMERFRAGQIDVLVATTVIEVGVDVPNASVMVVENAERFGLAQLHQLRGRVGRGSAKSACVLIGEATTDDARARLEAIASTTDGFALAERDLALRGPGEMFGLKQSGAPPFRVADLGRDLDLLKMARKDAAEWIARSPHLDLPEEALLRKRLLRAHGQWLDLGDVG